VIPVTIESGKNIALFGLGGSGMVTAQALMAGGANVTAYDDNRERVLSAEAAGIHTDNLRDVDFADFEMLVLAPGVPLTHPNPHWSVKLAKSASIEIVGDIELFCRQRQHVAKKNSLIAITGTNGKSTTTALISHVLENAGRKVEMGGNIGRAVLDFDAFDDDVIYVVEVSSYQIDLSPGLNADIGILLNVSPDHLDRHGTMANYAAIKESLVAKAKAAIIGVDDEYCAAAADRLQSLGGDVTRVSVHHNLEAGVYADGDQLYRADDEGRRKIADLGAIGSLRGFHNAQNACVAWMACAKCGLNEAEIQAGLSNFPGLIDRMEELGSVGNVLIVNDSKGTNADATDMALGSFDRIYWIAGGLAKEGGIEPLKHHFGKIVKAYLIGEAAPNFAGTLGENVEFEISETLDKALVHALEDARADETPEPVILMSPACASFDQFSSYAERGRYFRELVGQIDGFRVRETS